MKKNHPNKKQEEEKFQMVYENYKDLMYHVAYRILQNHHDAEDALIDALCKIDRNISRIGDVKSKQTKSFVVTITQHQAIDLYRRKKRREEVSLEAYGEGESTDFVLPEGEGVSVLSEAIARLPKNYREVILLRYAHGYSAREMADMLDCSISNVEKRLFRAKRKLKQMLAEVSGEME